MDVDDLWYNRDGSPSARHGKGSRWQARWRDPDRTQHKQRFARKRDAEQHLAQVAADKAAGLYVDPGAGKITLQAYAELWRTSRTHDPATADRIEREFRLHVYPGPQRKDRTPSGAVAIGHREIGMLARSPSALQSWIKSLPLAAGSARLVILDVGQVFAAAVDDRRIASSPLRARSIQRPARQPRQVAAWTTEQTWAVIDELPGHLQAMAILGSATGQRKGELFGSAVGDLNFFRKTLHVEWQVKSVGNQLYFAPLKNRCIRDVPVAGWAVLAVAGHLRKFPAAEVELPVMNADGTIGKPIARRLIFTRPDGRAHSKNSVQWAWAHARKKAGVPDVRYASGWHILRHIAASRWLSGGLSLAKTAALLGDTREVVLGVYAHFMPDDDGLARDVMDRAGARPQAGAPNAPPAAGG